MIVDPATSARMRKVRRRDTSPETTFRKRAWERGFRYRLHVRDLPGTPDIVFTRAKVAVFVHGCYWHRHEGCRKCTTPKRNAEFWQDKFAANVRRDATQSALLQQMGWLPIVVWQCETEDSAALDARLDHLRSIVDARTAA